VAGRVIDAVATRCVTAERDLTRALGASCQTAVGAHAEPAGKHDVRLRGWVGLPDGSEWIDDRLTGPHDRVGTEMAARMLAAGAGDLLRRAEREAPR
jgi:hydroxymethylbilane synthase